MQVCFFYCKFFTLGKINKLRIIINRLPEPAIMAAVGAPI